MTKDQLIQSFKDANLEIQDTIIPWYMWLVVVICTIILTILIIKSVRENDIFVSEFCFGAALGTIVVTAIVCFMVVHSANKNNIGTPWELEIAKTDWALDNFYGKYLKEQPKETFGVNDFNLNADGTMTVLLDTDKEKKTISSVERIDYTDTQNPYIKAVWVEGLKEYDIPDGFYSYELFLPRGEKND